MVHNIAIVDDEKLILRSLKWMFMDEPSFQVLTFQNPVKALEIIEKDEFAVVVTDLMMPEMDGITLIKKVIRMFPVIECIIMTASEPSIKVKSLNVPIINKPLNEISFRSMIEEAIARYESRLEP